MFLWFPADPSKTRIFNEAERKLSVERFFADQPAITEHKEGISWGLIKKALKNPVMLTCVWLYTCNNIVRHCSLRGMWHSETPKLSHRRFSFPPAPAGASCRPSKGECKGFESLHQV